MAHTVAWSFSVDVAPPGVAPAVADIVDLLRSGARPVGLLEALRQTNDPNPDDRPRQPCIVITGSTVAGDVSFYGPRNGPVQLSSPDRELLGTWVAGRALQPGEGGAVLGTGNRFGRLLVADYTMRQILASSQSPERPPPPWVYDSFLMSGNVVDGVGGDILARHAGRTGNEFTIAAAAEPAAPLIVIGLTADSEVTAAHHGRTVPVAGGPQDPITIRRIVRAFADVANLELDFA